MSSVPHVFLEQNHLSVFQQSPRYFSLTSDWACLHQCLSTGWYFTSILQLSPTQYLGPRWVCPGGLSAGPPTFLQMRGGQVPAILHQKKNQDLNKYGRSEDQDRLLKPIPNSQGNGWAQGASAGTMALISHRVQVEERDLLWVPSCWLPKLSTKKI